eukprot:s3467_g4.t1
MPAEQIDTFDRMLSNLDRDIATALHQFRLHGKLVAYALRRDDALFFSQLARSAADFLEPHQVKDFWKELRRSLPRFKQRRVGQDPHRLDILQDQWSPYFMQLEAGVAVTPEELIHDCHQRQMHLPTVQYEFVFGKPVLAKGGVLAVFFKKGTGLLAADYRGIMLLSSIAKRVHALLRKTLMHLLAKDRPQGQLGGFLHMQVMFGSQFLQLFGRMMDAMNTSSAIIFVDLSNAFHLLVRELVSGIHVPSYVEAVLDRLLQEGMTITELVELLQLPCLLQRLHAPPWIVQLVQDIHAHTCMQVPGTTQPVVTRRGTRPGSPLADCIFHILMQDITKEVNDIIRQDDELQRILTQANLPVETIVWADYVAIPVARDTAQALPEATRSTLQKVHSIFQRRGFTFNVQRGKTSVVASFKGIGAPAMRAQYQLTAQPGLSVFAPILCNRHLLLATRLQLFRALILSKMFFGLGSWSTPSSRQMMRIQGALIFMLRKIFRLTPDEIKTTSTATLLHRAQIGIPRARLAIDRLLHAQRVWQDGPEMLQHMQFIVKKL